MTRATIRAFGWLLLVGLAGPEVGWLTPPAAAAQPTRNCREPSAVERPEFLHAEFERLLRAFVRDGFVEYACFQQHEAVLDRYLDTLAQTDPSSLTRNEQLALWINAYNAFTIKLILRHYPGIRSIKDISRRWSRREWTVGGKEYSLGGIEHDILRKNYNEPRIHFAVNCASRSCPDLVSEAYDAARIDEQLEAAARKFLTDPNKGARTRREKGLIFGYNNYLYLSEVFDWFDDDFEAAAGSIVNYVYPYLSRVDQTFVSRYRGELSLRDLPYDWSLNGR